MNSKHRTGQDDKTLAGDLEALARAYRRTEPAEPPDLLDQAVLNSARRAAEEKPRRPQFSWVHGLSTAAVVVLAIALYHFQQPAPGPLKRAPAPPSAEPVRPAAGQGAAEQKEKSSSLGKRQDLRIQSLDTAAAPVTREDEDRAASAPAAEPPSADEPLRERAREQAYTTGSTAANAVGEAAKSSQPEQLQARKDADAETRIEAILALKRAGDDAWRDALRKFTETYPDYPLPEELQP